MIKSFEVFGKVQGVMFRKTFILGLINRKLAGGATNLKNEKRSVQITIVAIDESQIIKVINELLNLDALNSWHAKVEYILEINPIEISNHEVTTSNIDPNYSASGIEFYF